VIMSEVSNGKEVCRTSLKHSAGSVSYFPHPHTVGMQRIFFVFCFFVVSNLNVIIII
jgi:hypothetical protein